MNKRIRAPFTDCIAVYVPVRRRHKHSYTCMLHSSLVSFDQEYVLNVFWYIRMENLNVAFLFGRIYIEIFQPSMLYNRSQLIKVC